MMHRLIYATQKLQRFLSGVEIILPVSTSLGLAALAVARSEIGNGESEVNNEGPHVTRYRGNMANFDGPWCAAFVSHCLIHGSAKIGKLCPVKRIHNAKRLWRACVAAGCEVTEPQLGDIVLWHRGAQGATTGHIGIVSKVDGQNFWSIEGNAGPPPSPVAEHAHRLGERNLLGFARLA
jgi:hypothetical protein